MQVIHLVPRDNQPYSYFDNLVSISSTLYVQIFCTNVVFSSYVLALSKKFVRKIRAFNVDEIDRRCQFHQHFYVQIFHTKVVSAAFFTYIHT